LPVGFSELVVLFVIGLLILGPERLPRVAAQIGRWVGKARRTANQLRYQLEREVALADIEEKKKKEKKEEPAAQASEPAQTDDSPAETPARRPTESPAAEAAPGPSADAEVAGDAGASGDEDKQA
jgi:sec-independent protein translocase protein TatB